MERKEGDVWESKKDDEQQRKRGGGNKIKQQVSVTLYV